MARVYNFSAGPAVLPEEVLREAAGFVYSFQYDNSRKGLKRYFSRLNKLERFYNSEKKRR